MSNTLSMNIVAVDHASKVLDGVGDSADGLADRFKAAGDAAPGILGGLTLAAGAAAAGAVVAGFGGFLDRGDIPAQMSAQFGMDKVGADRAGKLAGELYAANYGESLSQIGDVMGQVYNEIGEGNEKWTKDIAAKVLTVSQTTGEETKAITRAAGQLLKTGLAQDTNEAMDLITKGMQSGINKSDDFLDTINEYSGPFQAMGLSGAQSIGLIGQALQGGARDADTAADALKEFSIRSIDGSKASAAGYAALGLNAKEMTAQIAAGGPGAAQGLDLVLTKLKAMKDPAEQSAAATALFGTKAEDMKKALLSFDVGTATQSMGDFAGATDKAAAALAASPRAKIEAFKRSAMDKLTTAVGATITKLGELAGFVQRNADVFEPLGIAVGILAASLGTVAFVIKTVAFATRAWAAAQAFLSLSFGPITLIVIGIAALAAGIVIAYKRSETFRLVVQALGKAAVAVFHAIVAAAKWVWNILKPIAKAIGSAFMTHFDSIKKGALIAWKIISTGAKIVGIVLSGVAKGVGAAWSKGWGAVKSAAGAVASWVKNTWSGVGNAISSAMSGAVKRITGALSAIPRLFSSIIGKLRGLWNSTIGGFSFTAPGWVPGIGGQGIKIPMLAQGGIVSRPTLAMIGEGGEPEMILPLSKARQQGFGGGDGMTVHVHVSHPLGSPEAIAKAVSGALRTASIRGNTYSLGRA